MMRFLVLAGLCCILGHSVDGKPTYAFSYPSPCKSSSFKLSSCRHNQAQSSPRLRNPTNILGQTLMVDDSKQSYAKKFEKDSSMDRMLQAARSMLPSAAFAILALSFPLSAPAEMSPEQKLIAQTWATVDATFVDRTFNNQDWFKIRQNLIKRR
jgi:hypothetical protein